MPPALRPMKLGEILDQGFSIYRKNLWQLAGIASLPAIVVLAIQCGDLTWWHLSKLVTPVRQPAIVLWSMLSSLVYFHISATLVFMVTPAYVHFVSRALFREKSTLVDSLRVAIAGWRRYGLIALLKVGAELIGPEAIAVGVFLGMGFAGDAAGMFEPTSDAFMVVLILLPSALGIFLFAWMSASFSLTIPASVLERMPSLKAMKRSWKLSKGGRSRIASTWFLMAIFMSMMNLIASLLLRWVIAVLRYSAHLHFVNRQVYVMASYGLNTVVASVLGPIFPVVLILLYYDQRVRKEGYDIERMIEAAGLTAPVSEPGGEEVAALAAIETAEPAAAGPAAENADAQAAGESLA